MEFKFIFFCLSFDRKNKWIMNFLWEQFKFYKMILGYFWILYSIVYGQSMGFGVRYSGLWVKYFYFFSIRFFIYEEIFRGLL